MQLNATQTSPDEVDNVVSLDEGLHIYSEEVGQQVILESTNETEVKKEEYIILSIQQQTDEGDLQPTVMFQY